MSGSSKWFQTFTISASARRRSMRKSLSTAGSSALTGRARSFCAFYDGARSIPCHWPRTRWRVVILPGPKGGMWRGGKGSITSPHQFFFMDLMFIQNQDAMRLEIIVAGKSIAGQKIMHGLVKLQAQG